MSHAVDTAINQLLDAGTLSNLQSGYIGRGIRIKGGNYALAPGEWKVVDSSGDNLKQNIVPLPIREPSHVLLSLLNVLIDAGQNIGSTQDIMLGKTPGQNTPATTSMAALDQGMKVLVAIMKRQYRAMCDEFRAFYKLKKQEVSADPEMYTSTIEGGTPEDWQLPESAIVPEADPSIVSDVQKMAQAEALVNRAMQRPDLYNPMEVEKRYLEALNVDGIEIMLSPPEPQPDPGLEFEKMKHQQTMELEWAKVQLQGETVMASVAKKQADTEKSVAQTEKIRSDTELGSAKYVEEANNERIKRITEIAKLRVEQNAANERGDTGGTG